jgi:hypothetical protein
VRFTITRSERAARRAPLAVVAMSCVIAAGSVMAAPRLAMLHEFTNDHYPIRFVLPVARPAAPPAADRAGMRKTPLAEIAQTPQPLPTPAAASVELAAAPSLPVPTVTRAPRAKVPGVIALSYSLAGGANAGDAIEVDKPVSFAGTDAGRIPIRIDGNAKVYAQGKRLAALIAAKSGEKAVPAGLGEDFVSLETLRALGIGVKYDAIRDRLILDPPGV